MRRQVVVAVLVGALIGVSLAWYLQRDQLLVVEVSADRVALNFEDRCAQVHADVIDGGFGTGGGGYYGLFGVHGRDDADELAACYDETVFDVVTRHANADDRTMLRGEIPPCRYDDPTDIRPCSGSSD